MPQACVMSEHKKLTSAASPIRFWGILGVDVHFRGGRRQAQTNRCIEGHVAMRTAPLARLPTRLWSAQMRQGGHDRQSFAPYVRATPASLAVWELAKTDTLLE